MRKKIMQRTLGAVLAVVFLSGVAQAMPPGGPHHDQKGPMEGDEPRLLESLQLTQDQIQLLKQEKFEKRKKAIKLRAEMETLQIDLEAVSTESKPDVAKVDRLTNAMGVIHGKMIAQRVKSIIYLRSILTAEQIKIMDARGLQFDRKGKKGHKPRGKGRR